MPRSLILRTIALGLLFVTVLFSLFVLFQGHDAPGGGFIAGLIASAVILIQFLAFPTRDIRTVFRPIFHRLLGFGLLLAGGSGFFGWIADTSFLDGFHWTVPLPLGGHLSVPSVSIFMALEEKQL